MKKYHIKYSLKKVHGGRGNGIGTYVYAKDISSARIKAKKEIGSRYTIMKISIA